VVKVAERNGARCETRVPQLLQPNWVDWAFFARAGEREGCVLRPFTLRKGFFGVFRRQGGAPFLGPFLASNLYLQLCLARGSGTFNQHCPPKEKSYRAFAVLFGFLSFFAGKKRYVIVWLDHPLK